MTADGNTRLNEFREPAPGDVGFQSTLFFYDTTGRLIQITNPMGEITRFEYDGSDRLTKKIDVHGNETVYTYDGSSRVTNIEDAAGNDTVITYTSPTSTKVTNREAEDTIYTIDISKRVTIIKDALLNETEFAYKTSTWTFDTILGPKIPVSGTPWERQKTEFTYGNTTATQHEVKKKEVFMVDNGLGPPVSLQVEEWSHNTWHDILTYEDPRGKTWTYTYKLNGSSESVGLVLTEVNPNSQTTVTNTYGSEGNKYRLESTTNGVSKTTSFAYNQNTANSYGAPDKVTQPSGAITNYKVDVRGRIYEATPPSGNTWRFEYDALDRQRRRIAPDDTVREHVYECCHLVCATDENAVGPIFGYDVLGRQTSAVDSNGNVWSAAYDKEGRMTTLTNPNGEVTTLTYDDIGRLTSIAFPGGWEVHYTYYEPGMLKSKKYKKGASETTTNFDYTDEYWLKTDDYSSGTDTEYEYYANGLIKAMKDGSGEKRYTWDDSSRCTKIEQGPTGFDASNINYTLEYSWNAGNQLTERKLTIRTLSAKTWAYTYTDDGGLDTVVHDSDTTNLDYLSDSRLKKVTLPNGATREFFYQHTDASHAYVAGKNSHLRLSLDKKSGGTTICSFGYELDKAGNRLSMVDHNGAYDGWGFDPGYRLTAETRWSAKTPGSRQLQYGYAYDAIGNRLSQFANGTKSVNTFGDNSELTAMGSVAFTYDHYGNQATMVNGGTTTTYTWNGDSRLTGITNGSSVDAAEYDGIGRRMRVRYHNSLNWTHFVWCELTSEVLCEYTFISSTFSIQALYTYGQGLLYSNRGGTKRFFHFDGLGGTRALTDTSEVVQDTYQYSAFGITEASTGSSVNPFRWGGMVGYYDDAAMGSQHGLLFLRNRYLRRTSGTFLSLAPEAFRLAGEHPYGYAENLPTLLTDPKGLNVKEDPPMECSGKWNARVSAYCHSCYQTGQPWNCRQICNQMANDYYNACATIGVKPMRQQHRDDNWVPDGKGNIVPVYTPPMFDDYGLMDMRGEIAPGNGRGVPVQDEQTRRILECKHIGGLSGTWNTQACLDCCKKYSHNASCNEACIAAGNYFTGRGLNDLGTIVNQKPPVRTR